MLVLFFASCGNSGEKICGQNGIVSVIKINDVPFFPIAIYTWCPDIVSNSADSELDILKGAGFNLIDVKLKDTTQNKYLEFMDRCKLRGINVMLEGSTEEATRGSNDPAFFEALIKNYGTHPALFGFSISDDANNGKYPISDLIALNKIVKEWDKNRHYTVCSTYPRYKRADYRAVNPAAFFGVTDLLFHQNYPIGNWAQYSDPPEFTPDEELLQNELECYLLQSYNITDRPWVATPQTFSWSFFSENKKLRLPMADELRNIVYVSLMNGAKGVIYYEFHIPSTPFGNHQEVKLYENDSLWNEIKIINSELKTLQDVFMFGKRAKFTTLSWTASSYWTYEGATYVMVANLHKTAFQHVEYAIGASGILQNVFSGREGTLKYADGKLSGEIPAKQVQVYKIL